MSDEQNKIMNYCQDIFLKDGFYKISMEQIATDLKMSKKTIYKHYPTKNVLVRKVVFDFIEGNKKVVLEIIGQKKDSVTRFHLLINFIAGIFMRGGDKLFIEVQKHMPDLWQDVDAFRVKVMGENISKLIEKGKAEKYFVDLPTALVLNVFISSLRGVTTPQFLMHNKFSSVEALHHTIKILMTGMLTEKGLKKFNKLNLGVMP